MTSPKRRAAALAAVLAAASLAACSSTASLRADTAAPPAAVSGPAPTGKYLGVAAPGSPKSYAPVAAFAALTGAKPDIAEYYSAWWEPFSSAFATTALRHGSYVLVDINPDVPLGKITAGAYDGYLRSFAESVKAFGRPVIISFAHEPDGPWWAWGDTRIGAATYVKAWRHVVDVFRAEGATNATWLWTVVVTPESAAALKALYPGDAYINWVGLNGYFTHPTLTYTSTFGPTMAKIRTFTAKPLLISETGVPSRNGAAVAGQVASLFEGAKDSPGVIGFVWFDYAQKGAPENWDLADDPAALAAFRAAVRGFG